MWLKWIWNLNPRGVDTRVLLFASVNLDHIWRIRNEIIHQHFSRCIISSYSSFEEGFIPPSMPIAVLIWSLLANAITEGRDLLPSFNA
ncbi:hypothetical protein TorRG33x02_233170, partial [Trema orientale]